MKYALQVTHFELSDSDRELSDKKLLRALKLIEDPYVCDVRLIRDRHHTKGDIMTCRIVIKHKKQVFHAERTGETVQDALDGAVNAMIHELQKFRDKAKSHHVS